MEKHQADIDYYGKKSARRKGILKEYVEFVVEEWNDIIRFFPTRWLSLELCCKKELKKYKGLKSMFQDTGIDESKKQVAAR